MRAAAVEAGLLVHRKSFTVKSGTRRDAVDVKPEVEAAIRDAGVQQGMVLVNCLHTTCSVVITDSDTEDFVGLMARLIEDEGAYRHNVSAGPTASVAMPPRISGRASSGTGSPSASRMGRSRSTMSRRSSSRNGTVHAPAPSTSISSGRDVATSSYDELVRRLKANQAEYGGRS